MLRRGNTARVLLASHLLSASSSSSAVPSATRDMAHPVRGAATCWLATRRCTGVSDSSAACSSGSSSSNNNKHNDQGAEDKQPASVVSLLEKLPKGWERVVPQDDSSISITARRVADEDGVVVRTEAEHRKIFMPYVTETPFSSTYAKKQKGNNSRQAQQQSTAVPSSSSSSSSSSSYTQPEVEEEDENTVYVSKKFSFGHFGPLYHWMGRVGAVAERIGVYPHLDWFFMDVQATVPLTEKGLHLAWYMNDEESTRGEARNTSEGGVVYDPSKSLARPQNSSYALDADTRRDIEEQAVGRFCWVIAGDPIQREVFTSEVYLQWYHRADYLVNRKAKEYAEFRNDLTLEQLLQSASQNRKRRKERAADVQKMRDQFKPMPSENLPPQFLKFRSRKERDTVRSMQLFGMDGRDGSSPVRSTSEVTVDDVQEMTPSRHQFAIDTLPREVRERLDSDDTITGFGGGVRQQDPVSYARQYGSGGGGGGDDGSSPMGGKHPMNEGIVPGGAWHS